MFFFILIFLIFFIYSNKNTIYEKFKTSNKKIVFKTIPNYLFTHFIHYMEYLYFCTDIILNNTSLKYIIIEPENKSNSMYVKSYLKKILDKFPNVILKDKHYNNDIYKEYIYEHDTKYNSKNNKDDYFILNDQRKIGKYYNWFPNNNSKKMRKLFLNSSNNNLKIGLVNRKYNRILTNYKQLCSDIKNNFNIDVDITYFEDKSFDYQINFFNEHKIIISPHGAQLCSIPFSQDDSLIIECVHEEWHPYNYFPGLSYTSNKYHTMVCDDHSYFPKGWGDNYINKNNRSDNNRLNINVNIQKIINIINIYLKNNKLESHNCYLV
jgi:hypothetical protein